MRSKICQNQKSEEENRSASQLGDSSCVNRKGKNREIRVTNIVCHSERNSKLMEGHKGPTVEEGIFKA